MQKNETVIDSSGLILGRLASVVAKRLLSGENIVIVNAENAVISGEKMRVFREAKSFLSVGHPGRGPYHYRRPDRMLRRAVRGMLPRRKPKGMEAYGRLKVYLGVPDEYKESRFEVIPEAKAERLRCPYVTLGELAKEIGWNPGV
ncbi:MAG: 50S ribosomal protein L13 [Candidatus Bathyarchaeia archaeon]